MPNLGSLLFWLHFGSGVFPASLYLHENRVEVCFESKTGEGQTDERAFVSQVTCDQTNNTSGSALQFCPRQIWGVWASEVGNPSVQRHGSCFRSCLTLCASASLGYEYFAGFIAVNAPSGRAPDLGRPHPR